MSVCPIVRHKSIRLSRMGVRHSCGDHAALKRFCQYCSNRPLKRFARRALAPRGVQNLPDCLSRDPMMVLHPASITPEPMKRCCFRKMGQRMRWALCEKYSASMRIRWQRWLAGFSARSIENHRRESVPFRSCPVKRPRARGSAICGRH